MKSQALELFQGLKVTGSAWAARDFPILRQVEIDRRKDELRLDRPGVLGDGGNSGFQALNLAVQMGARSIVLVGYDMRIDLGLHWHGAHANGLNNPRAESLVRWRRAFEAAAPQLQALGVEVINANVHSGLEFFPKRPLEELFP